MPRGDRVRLQIETLADGPDALAHIDGYVVLVPGALPGERVRAEVTSAARKFGRARIAFVGDWRYHAWMTFLTVLALIGLYAWCQQLVYGLVTTGMTDQVSWGLYIANFTFLVGMAAAAVLLVIPVIATSVAAVAAFARSLAPKSCSARIFSMMASGRMPSASASKLRMMRWRSAG